MRYNSKYQSFVIVLDVTKIIKSRYYYEYEYLLIRQIKTQHIEPREKKNNCNKARANTTIFEHKSILVHVISALS